MLRCAVIGVGYLGTFHAQKYKNNSNVQLVGVYDAFPAQAEKVAASLGVKAFKQLSELVGQVDAVTIATSTQAHFDVAQFFLKNKIAVNVEKPMTSTLKESEALLKIANELNTPLSVGHIERFNPAVLEVKKNLRNPKHIELKRVGPFKARGADVNVLYDLMIHDLDLAIFLTESEPESWIVTGNQIVGAEWDTCLATIQMKNKVQVTIQVSRVSPVAQRFIQVTQEGQVLMANTGTMEMTLIDRNPEAGEILLGAASVGQTLSADPLRVKTWTVEKKDALQEETNAFVKAVIEKKQMPVPATEAFTTMKWLARIEEDLARYK